jgi:hypothetical protein
MRLMIAGVVILLLADCAASGTGPADPELAAPSGEITARFQPGGLSDVVVVHAVDRLPLRSASLVGPNDARVPAYSLDVATSPLVGVAPGLDSMMTTPGAPRPRTRIGTMVSTALIQLPDPVAYGRSWQDWRVVLRFGDPGSDDRDMVLAAPRPPAPRQGADTPMPSTELTPR